MLTINKQVKQISDCSPEDIPAFVLNSTEPLILKDFAKSWPLVVEGKKSPEHAANYLRSIYSGTPVNACYGEPEINGRVFYNQEMTGFNYRAAKVDLNLVLDKLLENIENTKPPTMYVGSTEVNKWLPSFSEHHSLSLDEYKPLTSIWIGNQSKISAHYDFPNNIACCAVGSRRFTLFPPDQIKNLYVGPMELAPGGQDISLVDFDNPDYEKFPKFKNALASAQVAELSAGDALFLPSMWWHHVEGLTAFNVLITHWWRNSPAFMGRPNNALLLAILSLRNLPLAQRKAWQSIFDHYIFDHQDGDLDHLPEEIQGMLKLPLDELSARKIRAELLNQLKR